MAKKKLRDVDDLATPRTRTEEYLAHMAGKLVDLPAKQFSRLERYLKAIADRIDNGGGGGGVTSFNERTGDVVPVGTDYPPSLTGSQPQVTYVSVALLAANWTNSAQSVSVPGVSATETDQLIQPVPASASRAEYESCGVRAIAQAENSLTFTCISSPVSDLTIYVCMTELEVAT